MEAWKLEIEAIRQAAQFLAGVTARPSDPLGVGFERVHGLGPVVEIERERGQTSERPTLGTGKRQVTRKVATSQVGPRGKKSWPWLAHESAASAARPEVLADQVYGWLQ